MRARRILIVDDEPYILRILSFKLRRQGYETVEAASSADAEAALASQSFDLLLLDVALEEPTSGFELAARVRGDARLGELPIILLTARGLADDILRGRAVGANGYVTKPFSTEDLIQRVAALIGPAPP